MGGWGRQNPWPFQWGGGRSLYEGTWLALRDMLGDKGAAPIGTLEDAWREAKVSGVVKALSMPERAALQALPFVATDHIPNFAQLLGIGARDTEQALREAVSVAWAEAPSAVIPAIVTMLKAIDEDLDVVDWVYDETATFQLGMPYQMDAADSWGDATESEFPNYSHHFRLLVLWDNQPGGIPPADKLADVERQLNRVLPSWVDFIIVTDLDGFALDTDPLDYTAFGT